MHHPSPIDAAVDSLADELTRVRRHLHANPEPSGEEFETTRFVAARLADAGVPHRVVPNRRGVIAESPAPPGTPRVGIRGDMDALRIADGKSVPYCSTVPGVMHACGHDAHTTIALGAAIALWECRDEVPFAWRVIFQPSEETAVGAEEMVEAGATEDVDFILAAHVDPDRPVGEIGVRSGPLTASCRELSVKFHGHGGHSARPHQTADPIAAAVRFISTAYERVSRDTDARHPVVVAFGFIHGGSSPNVIPDVVSVGGTLRAFSKEHTDEARVVLDRIARSVEVLTGVKVELVVQPGPDAVVNDPRAVSAIREAGAEVLGPDGVKEILLPSMGGEDFSAYLPRVRGGAMFRLGVASERILHAKLHTPLFDIDERALAVGSKILAKSAASLARLTHP